MNQHDRDRFDALLEAVIDDLPPKVRALMDEVPVVVEDEPDPELLEHLVREGLLEPDAPPDELCGLHSGVALTHRSLEDPSAGWGIGEQGGPEQVHLFRAGIIACAGGFHQPDADQAIRKEIRITLLHELGHHFGLDEDDLDQLGYA